MQAMMTREAAERRLAELAEAERAKKAAAAAEDVVENERRELITLLERNKEAERAARLAAARTEFVAVHQALVERLVDLAPAFEAWTDAQRVAGSAGITDGSVTPVREIAERMRTLMQARSFAPIIAAQREETKRFDAAKDERNRRDLALAEKRLADAAAARRQDMGW